MQVRTGLAPTAGVAIGPFRLESRLGGGEDTEVWRASGDGIIVALKVLRDPNDVFAVARMAREAAALRRIHHPHVIGLLAADDAEGEPYLATTLRDGATLAALLDDGLLAVQVAAAILAPIAEALAAIHEQGVIHRDVKPSNIVVASDGVVLIDFGAVALDGTTSDGWLDGAAALVATPRYAAPELSISGAADVYSLGVVLVEAVTGVADADAAPISIRGLVRSCLSSDPDRRPTASDLGARLRDLAGACPIPSVPAPILTDEIWPDVVDLTQDGDATLRHGRELELARLVDEFDASVAAEELRATLLTAPPGAGKSWLLDLAARRVADHGAVVLHAACSEAVGDVRALAPWVRRIGDAVRIESLVGEHHASVLLHATGLAIGATTNADSAAIAEALANLLAHCGKPAAIIDDLHHATHDLIEVLGRLAFHKGVQGVLWLGSRSGAIDADDLDVRTIALGPLPSDVIKELGGEQAVGLAGGNPMLARELAHAFATGGVGDRGELVDADVRALIGARLDRLDARAHADLACVSTCGEVFWPETLEVTGSVATLCRAGMVRLRIASTVAGSTEATWVHPLLREVAYARLDRTTRGRAHLDVATKLDAAEVDVETVAYHAEVAFETGSGATPFVASAAARAGRSALDRFALVNAERWTALLQQTALEPVPGTTDTLRAELLLRRGEYGESARLADLWASRDDDIGTRALTISAEAHLATGELAAAEVAGRTAMARLPDSLWRDQVSSTYVDTLVRSHNYDAALETCDRALEGAERRGERAYVARLRAQRAFVRANNAMRSGGDMPDAIAEAQLALVSLRASGDARAFADAALEIAELISLVDPWTAIDLLEQALDSTRSMGYDALAARLANVLAAMTFDVGRPHRVIELIDLVVNTASEYQTMTEANALRCVVGLAMQGPDEQLLKELRMLSVGASDWLADVHQENVAVNLWFGRVLDADRMLPSLVAHQMGQPIMICAACALRGARIVPDVDAPRLAIANELALLAFIRGDRGEADRLLLERHVYLAQSGSTYQRYNQFYPGALVAALGPDETEPATDWLVDQILRPSFPYMWSMHRAICALLLAERGDPRGSELIAAARSLILISEPDDDVASWLGPRIDAWG